jgi:hypothetical protein
MQQQDNDLADGKNDGIYGESAGKEPKSVKARYGSPSTTARVLVSNDSLANLSLLKIQSRPI